TGAVAIRAGPTPGAPGTAAPTAPVVPVPAGRTRRAPGQPRRLGTVAVASDRGLQTGRTAALRRPPGMPEPAAPGVPQGGQRRSPRADPGGGPGGEPRPLARGRIGLPGPRGRRPRLPHGRPLRTGLRG